MKRVVAVSGGVDSVVLLNLIVKQARDDVLVAHFDHGIRDDSAADARFVEALANKYNVPFVGTRVELGRNASEEVSREARYTFLKSVASKQEAKLYTAHHRDDAVETVCINLLRGTGWRGLAVLNDPTIERPLLRWTKAKIYNYALLHALEWVEDDTNSKDMYLRNRVRKMIGDIDETTRHSIADLVDRQRKLSRMIDSESMRHKTHSRYFFTMIDESTGLEVLGSLLNEHSASLTRPQRTRLLLAIKTAAPGSTHEAGNGVKIYFEKHDFIVKHP